MTKAKVFEVLAIEISQQEQRITASGTVTTADWKDAELILRPSPPGSEKAVVEFDFVAQPPNGQVLQVITPIEASYSPLPNQGNFMGIRIYASNNSKELFLE